MRQWILETFQHTDLSQILRKNWGWTFCEKSEGGTGANPIKEILS